MDGYSTLCYDEDQQRKSFDESKAITEEEKVHQVQPQGDEISKGVNLILTQSNEQLKESEGDSEKHIDYVSEMKKMFYRNRVDAENKEKEKTLRKLSRFSGISESILATITTLDEIIRRLLN